MPIFLTALFILGLLPFSANADGELVRSCEAQMTIDQRYNLVEESDLTKTQKSVKYTQLMNEAFSPYLVQLHNELIKVSPEKIRALAKKLSEEPRHWTVLAGQVVAGQRKGLSAQFKASTEFYNHRHSGIRTPYTDFSKEVMTKLGLALTVAMHLSNTNSTLDSDRSILESREFRCARSFVRDDANNQMYIGFASVAQSAAALIAEEVPGWTAEEMLKEVMTQSGKISSAVVIHSIMLPPELLGPYGDTNYFPAPMVQNDRGLTMSPEFRNFIKQKRDEFAARRAYPFEFGHGCPVAHNRPGQERSGLQYFIDAIMYVYGALE